MKHTLKIILSCTAGLAVFIYALSTVPARAAPAGLYFNPGTRSVTQGQELLVDIYGTAAANFGAPSTNIVVKYPGNLLSVLEVSKAGSALSEATLTSNPAQQTVSFTQSIFGVSAGIDNKKLFSIKFRALAPGAATVDFTSNFLAGHTVAKNPSTYTIVPPSCPAGQVGTPPNCSTPPPPTCPAGQIGTPPNCSTPPPAPSTPNPTPPRAPVATPAPAPTPAPTTPDTSPPPTEPEQPQESAEEEFAIDNVKLTTGYDSATLAWTTTGQAASELTYGTSAGKLDNTAAVTKDEAEPTFSAKFSKLKPGTKYFYVITATGKDTTPVTEKGSFTTKSYPVLLRISQDGATLAKATIALKGYRESYTTNDKGEVALALNPGNYTLQVTKDSLSEEQTFTVKALEFKAGGTPDTQVISVAISAVLPGEASNILPLILGIVMLLLTLGGIVAVVLWKKRQAQTASLGYQSLIDDTPPAQPAAAPPIYEATYTPPAYYTQSNIASPEPSQPFAPTAAYDPTTATQPYASATPSTLDEPEPQDMWSNASYAQPAEAPLAPSQQVAETYQSPLETPPLPTVGQPTAAFMPPEEQAPIQPITETPAPSAPESSYEFGEDNSLTIHHGS